MTVRPSFEQLRHLVALEETLHFTRAATRCHISQPPFSRSISRLEEILGVALVIRAHSAIRLTPAGQAFAIRAREILTSVDDAMRTARAAEENRRRLRIGFIEYAYALLLPTGLEMFAQTVPECSIEPLDQPDHRPEVALSSGTLDMAFAAVSDPDATQWPDGIKTTSIITEPLAAIVPTDHRLAGMQTVSLGRHRRRTPCHICPKPCAGHL